jgi:cell division protein FtsL
MKPNTLGRIVFVFSIVFVFGVLSMGVTWRQSRALETQIALDSLRQELSVSEAERVELEQDIQVLSSRQRIVPEAIDRLGMHTPSGNELVLLLPDEGTR